MNGRSDMATNAAGVMVVAALVVLVLGLAEHYTFSTAQTLMLTALVALGLYGISR